MSGPGLTHKCPIIPYMATQAIPALFQPLAVPHVGVGTRRSSDPVLGASSDVSPPNSRRNSRISGCSVILGKDNSVAGEGKGWWGIGISAGWAKLGWGSQIPEWEHQGLMGSVSSSGIGVAQRPPRLCSLWNLERMS